MAYRFAPRPVTKPVEMIVLDDMAAPETRTRNSSITMYMGRAGAVPSVHRKLCQGQPLNRPRNDSFRPWGLTIPMSPTGARRRGPPTPVTAKAAIGVAERQLPSRTRKCSMRRKPTSLAAAIFAAALITSCGSDPQSPADTGMPSQSAAGQPVEALAGSVPDTPSQSASNGASPPQSGTGAEASDSAEAGTTPTAPVDPNLEKAAPVAPEQLGTAPEVFCPNNTHEGCHTYDNMSTYVTHILALISPMFDELYGVENRPSNFYYVQSGQTGPMGGCTNPDRTPAAYDSKAYAYCPVDRSIYTGQDALWMFYSGIGDAAPAIGYAHEWGHHIQTLMGVPPAENAQESIVRENQADCIAGAWVYYAQQSGYLEYPDDVTDIEGILQAIASSEGDLARDHGTLKERTDSVNYGYNYGLRGCNEYLPETPIYNG